MQFGEYKAEVAEGNTHFNKEYAKDMEMCLKHLKKHEGAIEDLVHGVNGCHDCVDNRKAEVNSLKGRVLDLETRNVLLEAKVRRFQAEICLQLRVS